MTIDDPRPPFDLEAFDRQTGGDRGLGLEVVRMFLEDCPVRVEAIRAAVQGCDAAGLRSSAHALRGAAAFLTAVFVVDAAAHLEALGREGRLDEAAAGVDRLDAAIVQVIPELRKLKP
jgi:two-component system sensor histidine kinase/response regulator